MYSLQTEARINRTIYSGSGCIKKHNSEGTKYTPTLCRTISKGPCSDKGLLWSIATNTIPFFLKTKTETYLASKS